MEKRLLKKISKLKINKFFNNHKISKIMLILKWILSNKPILKNTKFPKNL